MATIGSGLAAAAVRLAGLVKTWKPGNPEPAAGPGT